MASESNTDEIERARPLIEALLDGSLDDTGHARLEQLVLGSRAVAQQFVLDMHLDAIVEAAVRHEAPLATSHPAQSLDEAMILPAIREDRTATQRMPPPPPPSESFPMPVIRGKIGWRTALVPLAAAAAIAVAAFVFWPSQPQHRPIARQTTPVVPTPVVPTPVVPPPVVPPPPVATVTAIADATDHSASAGPLGSTLAAGQVLNITSGAAELTFASGATVVVQSPAVLHVIDGKAMSLESGSVAAHVPVAAHGFSVRSAGLLVVDQGTDFGVRTTEGNAAAEAHVFGGTVDVTGVKQDGQSMPGTVRLTTGHAVRHAIADQTGPTTIAYRDKDFVRDIAAVRFPVPAHSTGAGLKVGATDPNWWFASVPGLTGRQPALLIDLAGTEYAANSPQANWLSITAKQGQSAVGHYVLQTTVDLTGYDPSTVVAHAKVAVDDQVLDVLVNGSSTHAATPARGRVRNTYDLTLASQWKPGVNQVEVVLDNREFHPINVVGLQWNWDLTACATVVRNGPKPAP